MIQFLQGVTNKTRFIELCLHAVLEIGIPEDELLEMDMEQWAWVHAAWEEKDLRIKANFSNLMTIIANCHRRKQQKPFTPQDFLPRKQRTQREIEEEILKTFESLSSH